MALQLRRGQQANVVSPARLQTYLVHCNKSKRFQHLACLLTPLSQPLCQCPTLPLH